MSKTTVDQLIENRIIDFLVELEEEAPDQDSRKDLIDNVEKLTKIRTENRSRKISNDAALHAAVNLAGILLILHHEKLDAVTSKSLGFVSKLRF